MKHYLIILFLVFTGTSFAQAPRIDSMTIDEMKGELHIRGLFGSAQGNVTIDSVEMQVKDWSDSSIVSSIADTGRGWAGPVIIKNVKGLYSIERMISVVRYNDYAFHSEQHSRPYEYNNRLRLVFRIDLESILLNRSNGIRTLLAHNKTSYTKNCTLACPGNFSGFYLWSGMNQTIFANDSISYSTGLQCIIQFNPVERKFSYFVNNIKGFVTDISRRDIFGPGDTTVPAIVDNFSGNIILEASYDIKGYLFDTVNQWNYRDVITHGGTIDFTKTKIFELQKKPILTQPLSNILFSYRDGITLIWDTLPLMLNYYIQVSSDTLFSLNVVDTTISSNDIHLSPLYPLTKYFWRVVGINSEGQSYWSDIWNFTTGATGNVNERFSSSLALSVFPNPSGNDLNISYSFPDKENAKLILYDLTGKIIREQVITSDAYTYSEKWDVSKLPSGSYILGLSTVKESKSKVILVSH
jgi:hypothetical protein